MKEKVDKFCENYEVHILNDQKRRARYHRPFYFTEPDNASIIRDQEVQFETEAVLTVEIPEGRFRSLIEMEDRFFNRQRHEHHQVGMFDMLMEKEREEAYIRHTNAAAQKAYEQYSMMLHLAGYTKKL